MSSRKQILWEAMLISAMLGVGLFSARTAFAEEAETTKSALQDSRAFVKLQSIVQVERIEDTDTGTKATKYYAPQDVKVVPGDRLFFKLSYTNKSDNAATGFVATNPMPNAVEFSSVEEKWAVVSIDGGKNYGKLTDMTMDEKTAEGMEKRPAKPSDVTHVRWVFKQPISAGEAGQLSFRGVVK